MTRLLKGRAAARGVTAVELIIIILLLVILAAFAIPGMSPVVLHYRARGAAWQLAGDLRLARQRAVTQHMRFRICVKDGSCALALPPGSYHVERDAGSGTWVSDSGAVTRLPEGVQLTACGSTTAVSFSPNGTASGGTLIVSNVFEAYQIVAAATGRVRLDTGGCP